MMELSRETAERLSQHIQKLCGLALGKNKDYLIRHRLKPLVLSEGLSSYDQLLDRLQGRGGSRLHDPIIEAITTKETSFFRDKGLFSALQQVVLPQCVAGLSRLSGRRHRIRIWSAACATGQESYSLAMLILDFIVGNSASSLRATDFTILASDISAESIETAKTGRYSRSQVGRGLSEELLARYFLSMGELCIVNEPVRRMVQFQQFDLLQPPTHYGAFDLILCRNVLIYFDEATRRKVCDGFYRILHAGGWLAVGAAESLFGVDDRFETVKVGRTLLYRKPLSAR